MSPGRLIHDARRHAGLTQAALADRLHTSQSAIARLESDAANPRISTLMRVLDVCDREMVLESRPRESSIDETLVARRLRLSPGERIKSFEQSYAHVRDFALAAARSRGELA